jgi:hypothetical protein
MDQRFNILTLGVEDVPRATTFYEIAWIEALLRNPDGTVALPA